MQTIYEPKGRAREYGDFAVNIYDSCNHGCIYCWAKKMAKRFGRQWTGNVNPRKGIVDALKSGLAHMNIKDREINLCFTCDPYPADIDTTVTREVIKAIKNSGNHVRILTKGGFRAVEDFDLLDNNDYFGVSITGDDFWIEENEPKAAPLTERSQSLLYAHDAGIKTWVSFEPVFFPEYVYEFIQRCDYIDTYKIGKLNYAPSSIDWSVFGQKCEQLCKEHGRDYYIKKDLRAKMKRGSRS